MDIHRIHLKLRELKQRRRRAGRVRQPRLLAQQPKLRVLEQWAKLRVGLLEQWVKLGLRRRRAGRARQLRVLEQMTKLRVLEQRASTGRACASTAASNTAAKSAAPGTAGESCHAHCHTPFRPRLPCSYLAKSRPQSGCLAVTSVPPNTSTAGSGTRRNCGYWNSGLKASTGGYQRRAYCRSTALSE